MASAIIYIVLIIFILWIKAKNQNAKDLDVQNRPRTPDMPAARPVQRNHQARTQYAAMQQALAQQKKTQQRQKTQPRTVGNISGNKANVNRSLAGMNDGDVEQPTKIEQRRKQQQATADKSRIHQELHKKEIVEQKQKEWEEQIKMSQKPTRFEFEDSDLMAEVSDLIVCGYPTELRNQRDFVSEGTDFLNRLSSGEA